MHNEVYFGHIGLRHLSPIWINYVFFNVSNNILKTLTFAVVAAISSGVDLWLSFFPNFTFKNSGVSSSKVIMVKRTSLFSLKQAQWSIFRPYALSAFTSSLNKSCFFNVFVKILKTLKLIFLAVKSIGADLWLSFFPNITFDHSGASSNAVIMVGRTTLFSLKHALWSIFWLYALSSPIRINLFFMYLSTFWGCLRLLY